MRAQKLAREYVLGGDLFAPSYQRELAKPRFIDLFAGIGGFRLGFEALGACCVFSCEINPECQKTYYSNFSEYPHGDILKLNPALIPDHENLCAGFPCQPFSISGLKLDFKDTKGTLFF